MLMEVSIPHRKAINPKKAAKNKDPFIPALTNHFADLFLNTM